MSRSTPSLFVRLDPFAADPASDSFLPSKGLFSPAASRATPNYCTTIFEEDDSDSDCDDDHSTITSRRALPMSIAIHPRILRADSVSDDDASDAPPVLRFPVPPTALPSRSPPKPIMQVTIPPPPSHLKSCFEDDDDDDASNSPTFYPRPASIVASRPAPSPPKSAAPMALLKRATNALRSSSPPKSKHEKPLPRIPSVVFDSAHHSRGEAVSPTPSLSSSSSSSLDSGSESSARSTAPYIPVGSIIPAPAIVQDLDDYLETLEMYFPSEMWSGMNEDEHHPHQQQYTKWPVSHSRSSSSESASSASGLRSASSSSDLKRRTSNVRIPSRSSSPLSSTQPKSILKPSKSTPHLRDSRSSPPPRPTSPPASACFSPTPSRRSNESARSASSSSRHGSSRSPIPFQLVVR